jgi:hypothetical protein
MCELATPADESEASEGPKRAERHVEPDRLFEHEPVAAPIFADQRKTTTEHLGWREWSQFFSVQFDGAADPRAPCSEEMHEQLRAARSHEAAEADHLALRDAERDAR